MHKVAEGEIEAITRPTVLFYHTEKLEISDISYAETDPPENHQNNGATPPVNTQPYPPHLPPEDTSSASYKPLPCPRFEARDAKLQEREGYLLGVCLLSAE